MATHGLSGVCRLGTAALATVRRVRRRPVSDILGTGSISPLLGRGELFLGSQPRQHNHAGQGRVPALSGVRGLAVCCNNPGGCVHQEPPPGPPPHQQTHQSGKGQVTEAGLGCDKDHEHGSPCWACGKLTGCCNFFCTCGKIQPVVGHCSYFETFHLPKKYDLDPRQLERSFWDLQMSLHPDRYGQKSSTEQHLSKNNSTYLNVAYKTLKDPTLRAKYLLQLEGINALDEASKSADPVLLMEVMELREKVDSSQSAEEMRELLRSNAEAMEELKRSLADHYRARDFEAMLDLTNRLQYLTKVHYEAREKLDRLEDICQRQQQRTGSA